MAEYSFNFQERNLGPKTTLEDIEANWLWALIGYFGPLFFVVLMIKRESVFAIYHARQGMGLSIAEIAWFFLWTVTNYSIPGDISFLFYAVTIIFSACFLGLLGLSIVGMVNAFAGTMKPLYLVGKYFEKD